MEVALGVIGPSRSVIKTCEDGPVRAADAAARVSRHLASDGHSATRSWPCEHAVDPSTARPETIGGRTARKPGDRGGSRSGSWLRPDGPSGCPSWRRPSAARLRARVRYSRVRTREFTVVGAARPPVRFSTIFPLRRRTINELSIIFPQCQRLNRLSVASAPLHRARAISNCCDLDA
jgi:hypothetical protein